MTIYVPELRVVASPAVDTMQSIAPVLALLRSAALLDSFAVIDAQHQKIAETLKHALGAMGASWSPPTITLPRNYKSLSAGARAQLTAQVAGFRSIAPSVTVPTFPRLDRSSVPTFEHLRTHVAAINSITVVVPKLPPALLPTVPSIGLRVVVPDMPWLRTFRPPASPPVRPPQRESAPANVEERIDCWLSSIRADLPGKRAGMRWALHNSPDGVCQAAASAVELFDHVLLELAPDDAVILAAFAHLNPKRFLRESNYGPKPTWAGRARVAAMVLGGDDVAQELAVSFVPTRSKLERMKHKSHLYMRADVEGVLADVDLFLRHFAAFE